LCEEARPLVQAAVRELGGRLVELDVDRSEELAREFGSRVPVVRGLDGQVVAEGIISPGKLGRRLKKMRKQSGPPPEGGGPAG
jgi:hypothetical protein